MLRRPKLSNRKRKKNVKLFYEKDNIKMVKM
jgi:hypothetical protein